MATMGSSLQSETAGSASTLNKRPLGGMRFDWSVTLLAGWTVGGIFLDGWAHEHGKVDTSFFTIWHALLYSGYLALSLVLVAALLINHRAGYSWQKALPAGYNLALIGVMVFGLGGVGDMVWHTVLGIEVNTEALLSPTHLMLALGIALMVSGPLRAAWLRLGTGAPGWKALLPALLSALALFAMFNFFTQFAHPFVDVLAGNTDLAAADGKGLTKMHNEIYQMRADGRGQTRLFNDPTSFYAQPAYSPDGQKIVYNADLSPDSVKPNADIYVANADGTNPNRLTTDQASDYFPSWSPDGKQIAFISQRAGNPELYLMAADGTNPLRLTNNSGFDGSASWSPDGTKLAYQSEHDGKSDIYVINADGTNQLRLTRSEGDNFVPAWSPDGTRIAFNFRQNNDDEPSIYLMNSDGTNPTRLTEKNIAAWYPAWSPDGQQLLYMRWQSGNSYDIYALNLKTGSALNLTNLPPGWSLDRFSWSPDGKSIIYSGLGPSDSAASSSGGWQVSLGVAAILLQAALMVAIVLFLLKRWQLPFGTVSLLLTVNAALVSLFRDTYYLIPVALLTGLIADLFVRQWQPSATRLFGLRVFAGLVPVVLYGLYFLEIGVLGRIVWSAPLWGGSIFLAGITGLGVSYLVFQPRPPKSATV